MYVSLKGLGHRHNCPRHSAEPGYDPRARDKTSAISTVLSSPAAGNHVLHDYDDEGGVRMFPILRSMWMLRDKQVWIPMPGTNQKMSVVGAMDIRTGAYACFTVVSPLSLFFRYHEMLWPLKLESNRWISLVSIKLHASP